MTHKHEKERVVSMKCQLNVLEILDRDQLKITVKPDVSERIKKEFFFFKRESLVILLCKKL